MFGIFIPSIYFPIISNWPSQILQLARNFAFLFSTLALFSVSDKTNLHSIAKEFNDLGFKLIASGGTAKVIRNTGIEVRYACFFLCFPKNLSSSILNYRNFSWPFITKFAGYLRNCLSSIGLCCVFSNKVRFFSRFKGFFFHNLFSNDSTQM